MSASVPSARISVVRGPALALLGIVCLIALLFVALRLRDTSVKSTAVDSVPEGAASDVPDASPATAEAAAPVHSDVVPVWNEWPAPQLGLLVTGEQHGYFEPCGCTSNQMGGMSRRANLAKKLTDAGWTLRGVDLGGLARRSVRQAQIKFETSLLALRELNYAAVGLGPEDLRLSPDFLLSQQHLPDDEHPLFLVSANLVFFDTPELGTPTPTAIVTEQGVTVGITSVLSESLKETVLPEGANLNITWSEPGPAIEKAMATFDEAGAGFRVLLSHGTLEESRALAEQFPGFDVILAAEGPSDPDPTALPDKVGKTLVLELGRKGKYAGVIGIYPDDNETPVRFQLIPLERSAFDDTPEMVQLMQEYQERLRDEQIVLSENPKLHPSGAFFLGSETCGECHSKAYEVWAASGHAHALESLDPQNQRTGYERLNGVARMFDPECLACHVTGWNPEEYFRYESGFLNEPFATTDEQKLLEKSMAGSGCENCHGPGSRHVELVDADDLDAARQEVRVTLQQAKDNVCYKCHDVDNSPHFEFDDYWPKVEHKGMD
ncbi:MAG: multiheme c-type cytochrome [Planctomycetaceae bacterium]